MSWDRAAEQMQRDLAPMGRAAAIGYLRRRPGDVEALLDRLQRAPDGGVTDYPAAVEDLAAYGRYLVAAAEALRSKHA